MKKVYFILMGIFLFGYSSKGQSLISVDSLKKHVYYFASDSIEGRSLGSIKSKQVAQYIANYFESFGIKSYSDTYFHSFYHKEGQVNVIGNNVVGVIEGSDPVLKNEYIVLGAHYDHVGYEIKNGKKIIYNGADDNATGTAAIIELGRELMNNRSAFKRSIVLVAFDGEESGLLGSKAFVDDQVFPTNQIKMMLSIDMIGRYAESSSLIVGAMQTVKDGDDILLPLAQKHNIEIKKMGKNISGRTDSKYFGSAGIPALHITSGIIGPYHKPEDDAETIDYQGMEKISNLLYALTIDLSNAQELKPIRGVAAQIRNGGIPFFRYGLKANIGSGFHKYPNEFYNGKTAFSAEAGVFAQLKLSNHFAIQPEILYSTIGSDTDKGAYRNHSVTTPVSVVLAGSMNKMYDQRFYLLFGGYYTYNFSGTLDGKNVDYKTDFEEFEYGLSYGIGVEMMSLHFCVTRKHGLSGIVQDKSVADMQNRATYFTIGYMF